MAKFDIVMPKMGESVEEATITKWFVKEGDKIEEDDVLLEIATDKVDSEIPSPVDGKISKVLFKEDDLVPVGSVIAVVDLGGEEATSGEMADELETEPQAPAKDKQVDEKPREGKKDLDLSGSSRFYSPLVKSIAEKENISSEELDNIKGSGSGGRVRKEDVLNYLEQRDEGPAMKEEVTGTTTGKTTPPSKGKVPVSISSEDEIIEMDRLRKLIAENMIRSKQVSAHVTNMVEADVTNLVLWRNKVKEEFAKREGEKLTYLPLILEATVRALKDFPKINAQVDGDKIIIKKKINLGVAVALPNDNLIVPVIKEAEQKNVVGITKSLNDLATRARGNKLSPDDIQGGTFSVSNFGTFRNVMGTPIINQPQVAILAIGTIEKKPAVVETDTGDVIAVRHKMFLSLTYDHRIIDGALGGAFLRKLADYLEGFDINRTL
jgi:2-oxoglutarate dehydrogenase E2 component (dihydrolipoamide succinyltransferase)